VSFILVVVSVLALPSFSLLGKKGAYLDGREWEVAWWAEGRGREGEAEDVSALIDRSIKRIRTRDVDKTA
jgi:hypothetical protein